MTCREIKSDKIQTNLTNTIEIQGISNLHFRVKIKTKFGAELIEIS